MTASKSHSKMMDLTLIPMDFLALKMQKIQAKLVPKKLNRHHAEGQQLKKIII